MSSEPPTMVSFDIDDLPTEMVIEILRNCDPDTLVSYVRYWGKVKEPVSTAKLVSIDTKVCTPSVRRDIRVPGADATACDVGHEPHVPDEGQ